MGTAEQIRQLRSRANLTEEELAAALKITPQAVRDLEDDDSEVESALSIPQALALAGTLSTDILSILGEPEADRPAAVPIARVRGALKAEFSRSAESREMLEDDIDWDLGPFLDASSEWQSVYTIAFVKRLSAAIGGDWRAVLLGIATDNGLLRS